jgi:carboxylate-amine ligase
VEDAAAIASLYRCLVRFLYRKPEANRDLGAVDRAIALENKWRAQRYGVEGSFVSRDGAISVAQVLETVIEGIREDAEALDCVDDLYQCQSIVVEGTSADAQLRVFRQHIDSGPEAALFRVKEWIKDATLNA